MSTGQTMPQTMPQPSQDSKAASCYVMLNTLNVVESRLNTLLIRLGYDMPEEVKEVGVDDQYSIINLLNNTPSLVEKHVARCVDIIDTIEGQLF